MSANPVKNNWGNRLHYKCNYGYIDQTYIAVHLTVFMTVGCVKHWHMQWRTSIVAYQLEEVDFSKGKELLEVGNVLLNHQRASLKHRQRGDHRL